MDKYDKEDMIEAAGGCLVVLGVMMLNVAIMAAMFYGALLLVKAVFFS